jgi:hypothetical protein
MAPDPSFGANMNDYGTGASQPSEFDERGPWFYQARQRVQSAATALQWYGMISIFIAVLVLGIMAAAPDAIFRPIYDKMLDMRKGQPPAPGQQPLPPYDEFRKSNQMQNIVASAISLACSALIFLGGTKMKQLQGYGLSIAASILSIIPCTNSCCCVGLPIGIWALMVLLNADVKLAFSRNVPTAPPQDQI